MQNPFLGLYQIMSEATKIEASFFIARITSPLPNLKVNLNDIELDKDNLLIDKWLKDRNDTLFTENEGHRHQIKEPIQDTLKVNDKVLLLKIEDKFIILSKVVSV